MRPTYGYTDPRNYRVVQDETRIDNGDGALIVATEHRVGFTQVTLSTGDVIRFHLFIDKLKRDERGNYAVTSRLVPEIVSNSGLIGAPESMGHA